VTFIFFLYRLNEFNLNERREKEGQLFRFKINHGKEKRGRERGLKEQCSSDAS